MTRRRSLNKNKPRQSANPAPPNVLQTNRASNQLNDVHATRIEELSNLKSLLIDDDTEPKAGASSSTSNSKTAALYDELDSFRQRWKRELDTKKPEPPTASAPERIKEKGEVECKENKARSQRRAGDESDETKEGVSGDPVKVYALAKKLFLTGVELEQDECHHESIRYYKQAVHLCPDIEHQIFKEQCEASLKTSGPGKQRGNKTERENSEDAFDESEQDKAPLYDRIYLALREDLGQERFSYCRPTHRQKATVKHISDLPHDILLQILRYVVGQELDLASLEALGLACRGFFILTRDPSLWRSVCHRTWGDSIFPDRDKGTSKTPIDWRQLYLEKPRVNCDGVYMSRTKYVRQGDISFQDMSYRPFHVVRYYRYLRFFPDKRVLILTTNEEPERIIPIFRHALHAKQISELSALEGTYEFTDANHVVINAEKDFTIERSSLNQQQQHQTHHQRRQALFHWSRQTPLWQKSNMKFQLRTSDNRPYRNNVLKWLEYTITTALETGQEVTTYDLNPDTFPSLAFSRVKKFNLRLSEPLSSH